MSHNNRMYKSETAVESATGVAMTKALVAEHKKQGSCFYRGFSIDSIKLIVQWAFYQKKQGLFVTETEGTPQPPVGGLSTEAIAFVNGIEFGRVDRAEQGIRKPAVNVYPEHEEPRVVERSAHGGDHNESQFMCIAQQMKAGQEAHAGAMQKVARITAQSAMDVARLSADPDAVARHEKTVRDEVYASLVAVYRDVRCIVKDSSPEVQKSMSLKKLGLRALEPSMENQFKVNDGRVRGILHHLKTADKTQHNSSGWSALSQCLSGGMTVRTMHEQCSTWPAGRAIAHPMLSVLFQIACTDDDSDGL
jgi:hypothetical protein